MKKLIIAAAIACAAALSQAATVNWTINSVKADGGAAPTAGWAVMAFYTEVGAGSAAIESAIKAGTAGSLAFETKELAISLSKGKVNAHDATVAGITDTSKNYDVYFVVFNNADATKADKYAIASDPNKEYSSLDGKYVASANFTGATWVATSSSVPEPTSGLLMLLGVAGLALRRKRA